MPCIPLKLDMIFCSNVCKLLKEAYIHKCQALICFWLSLPLRFLIEWDNKVPKPEDRPTYYRQMDRWRKKNKECKDVIIIINHRLLYRTLVQKYKTGVLIREAEMWERVQDKELNNRCKDFN